MNHQFFFVNFPSCFYITSGMHTFLVIFAHFITFQQKKRSSPMIIVVYPPTRKKSQDSRFTCFFTRLSFSVSMSGPLSSSSPCTLIMKYICNHARSNIKAAHLMIDKSTPLVFIQSTTLSCLTEHEAFQIQTIDCLLRKN